MLTRMENDVHRTIDDRYSNFEETFKQEKKNVSKVEEDNRKIQFKIGEILQEYQIQTDSNSEYISHGILDKNPDNEQHDTVESLQKKIDVWKDDTASTLKFQRLQEIENEYDKIHVQYAKDFEDRLTNLTQVSDVEYPLKAPPVAKQFLSNRQSPKNSVENKPIKSAKIDKIEKNDNSVSFDSPRRNRMKEESKMMEEYPPEQEQVIDNGQPIPASAKAGQG